MELSSSKRGKTLPALQAAVRMRPLPEAAAEWLGRSGYSAVPAVATLTDQGSPVHRSCPTEPFLEMAAEGRVAPSTVKLLSLSFIYLSPQIIFLP